MTARAFFLFLSLLIIFSAVAVQRAPAESIDDYKERTKKEQEENDDKNKKEKRHRDDEYDNEDDDDGGCGALAFGSCLNAMFESGCFDALFTTVFNFAVEAASGIRYPEYPYYPDPKRPFARRAKPTPPPAPSAEGEPPPAEPAPAEAPVDQPRWMSKIWMGELSASGSYLLGQDVALFDASGNLTFNMSAFQINTFYQFLWDEEGGTLHTFSMNGGFVFPSRFFTLSLYAGLFLQEGFSPYVSFGAAAKAFFTSKVIVSFYSLFAIYDTFFFIILNPALEYAVGRFTFGAGFNYYNYNDFILYGPTVRVAMWF
jgi:hypothetical protein